MSEPRHDADEDQHGVSEPWNGSVPQPRDPADHAAVGSARAVSASASVPMASRVTPADPEETPWSSAPQPRVYGRAPQPVEADEQRADDPYPNGRAPTARAAASARVGMPAADPNAPGPYAEPTTDVAGRGRRGVQPENDYSGESGGAPGRPYGQERPARSGPGAAAGEAPQGATATWQNPGWPAQGQPSTWPAPGETPYPGGPGQPQQNRDVEQGRFDQFAAEQPPAAVSAKPETPHVRMIPILLGVIVAAALLVGVAIGIVWLISRGSESGFSVSAGECVKRSGNEAVKADCGDPGTYQVVSIADSKDQCADPKQPYVVNPTKNGKTQVLCLKPSS